MKRLLVVGLVVLALVAISGVAFAATRTVKAISGDKWSPMHLFISKGDAVVFKNPSTRVHDLKATTKNWTLRRVLDPGESVRKTFGTKGFYKYRCLRHSGVVNGVCQGMCGFIHVFS